MSLNIPTVQSFLSASESRNRKKAQLSIYLLTFTKNIRGTTTESYETKCSRNDKRRQQVLFMVDLHLISCLSINRLVHSYSSQHPEQACVLKRKTGNKLLPDTSGDGLPPRMEHVQSFFPLTSAIHLICMGTFISNIISDTHYTHYWQQNI